MALPVDRQKHLIQVPFIAWLGASPTELIGVLLPGLAAPFPDGLVGHDHAADEQEFLHITVAEAEPIVQPYAMADDFGGETVVLVAVGRYWCVHTTSISHPTAAQQVDNARTTGDGRAPAGPPWPQPHDL
jgi:hypothetical protein